MKSKIFNPLLFTLMVLLTISTAGYTQQATPAQPVKPVAPKSATDEDDNEADLNSGNYQLKMKDLQIKMKDLQVKMKSLNKQHFNKNIKIQMKNFTYKFDSLKFNGFKFKDSLVNFAYKIDLNIAPMVAYGFKDFNENFNFDYDTNDNISTNNQDQVDKTKSYSKTYTVDGNDIVNIDNKFGKITVNTWTKNEVKVDVQVKVTTNNDGKAQKMLDNVNIRDNKDGAGVYFKTDIASGDDNNSWGSLFNGRHNSASNIEITYTVYMPAKNPLTISNKYGATDLPDLSGKVIITNSFGALVAKVLSNPDNLIKVKYGSANIGSLNGSDLDVAFGSLDLGDCDKLTAKLSYSSAKIGRIKTSGNINIKFGGGLSINELDKNIKSLDVNSSYSSIKLNLANDQNSDFDVTVRYGSFNYDDHNVSMTSMSPSDKERGFNPTKNYKGHLGKGGTEKTITINSNFGSVKFD